MAKYVFLSEEWFVEVRRLQQVHGDAVSVEAEIRMNLRITETPFGADREMHMSAEEGRASWGMGHVEEADVSLILGYEVAREIFLGGNPQAAIEAFLAGKITMSGDITKLMTMQAAQPGHGMPHLARALLDITE